MHASIFAPNYVCICDLFHVFINMSALLYIESNGEISAGEWIKTIYNTLYFKDNE